MGMWQNKNLIPKLVAIQIPESVYVGKAIHAFIENLLCGIPLILVFKYSLKWQLLYGPAAHLIAVGLNWDWT